MFTINHIKTQEKSQSYLELKSPDGLSSTKISLVLGGSVQELILNTKQIIKYSEASSYMSTYASSLLFPFVNRIKDGKFEYEGKKHQLEVNLPSENNAIHGLVYYQEFELVQKEVLTNSAEVTLKYSEKSKPKGFPYDYTLYVTYKLTSTTLDIKIKAENDDVVSFPFSVGWHPYIHTSDLHNSYLKLNSTARYTVDERNIPIKEKPYNFPEIFQIKDTKFDDCFILNTNKVDFVTPDYEIEFTFYPEKNYLQLYTPDSRESLAIEPLTSPSDCFNNNIGIQILKPKETYKLNWVAQLKSKKH